MVIRKYNDANAYDAHSGTIRAHEVLDKASGFAHPLTAPGAICPARAARSSPTPMTPTRFTLSSRAMAPSWSTARPPKVACGGYHRDPRWQAAQHPERRPGRAAVAGLLVARRVRGDGGALPHPRQGE